MFSNAEAVAILQVLQSAGYFRDRDGERLFTDLTEGLGFVMDVYEFSPDGNYRLVVAIDRDDQPRFVFSADGVGDPKVAQVVEQVNEVLNGIKFD